MRKLRAPLEVQYWYRRLLTVCLALSSSMPQAYPTGHCWQHWIRHNTAVLMVWGKLRQTRHAPGQGWDKWGDIPTHCNIHSFICHHHTTDKEAKLLNAAPVKQGLQHWPLQCAGCGSKNVSLPRLRACVHGAILRNATAASSKRSVDSVGLNVCFARECEGSFISPPCRTTEIILAKLFF